MPSAAFFDLDKTVIARSSTLAFGRPFYKAGFLGKRTLMKVAFGQLMYTLFGADHDALARARDEMLELTAGWHRAEIEQLVEETLVEVAVPLFYAEALTLIDEHRRAGRKVFLVSASPEQIVRPIGRHIGVTDFVATRIKSDASGFFLPEIELYAMGPEKAGEMLRLAAEQGLNLAESFAYSDSATDLPMLELVGHPHVVNPDRELRKVAQKRGWPVLEFSRDVSLPRLPRPSPVLSGATVTAAVAGAVAYALLRRRPGS
jgi:HAD superfamily hydrolase (TIGR01490 family)